MKATDSSANLMLNVVYKNEITIKVMDKFLKWVKKIFTSSQKSTEYESDVTLHVCLELAG